MDIDLAPGGLPRRDAAAGAKAVVGIEICEPAVADAAENARLNGLVNCEFLAGRAEDKIREAIEKFVPEGGSCVAVVDPPREGLHKRVIAALRATPAIERVVYVSCNHVAWVDQARQLCTPSQGQAPGAPFEPVLAHGVDLFPHTPHVELVVLLERGETLRRRRAAEQPSVGAPQDHDGSGGGSIGEVAPAIPPESHINASGTEVAHDAGGDGQAPAAGA